MSQRERRPGAEPASAAEWFVALDSSARDDVRSARFAAWLDRAAEHELELERCDAAAEITRGLADDPELRWAYDEAAALANAELPSRRVRVRRRALRFGWAAGLVAAGLAGVAALWLARDAHGPEASLALERAPTASDPAGAADSASSAFAAERRATFAAAAARYPIARLPSGGVVDAGSVAVLPFRSAAQEGLATGELAATLSREIGATLAALPGIYVVGSPQATAYIGTELAASELGDQLGVRGVVAGDVAESDGQIRVAARLLDAATDRQIWQDEYERPVEDLPMLAAEIGDAITEALVDPALRARATAGTFTVHDARADNSVTSARADFVVQ
jgi:TolB-like protein